MDAEQIIVNGCTINWCNWLVYYDNEDDDVAAQMILHLCHGGAGSTNHRGAFTYSICMASGFAFNHN